MINQQSPSIATRIDEFGQKEQLTDLQAQQFHHYLLMLQEWNQRFNLTALETPEDIISFHFRDSLRIREFIDFNSINAIADIGTGAGFPGLPLKICFPHLAVTLLEVNKKKITFLNAVIEALSLHQVTVLEVDWRTFLRNTQYTIDIFLSRAALAPQELIRMFSAESFYKKATLIYWASNQWKPTAKELPLLYKEFDYTIDHKIRKFIIFKKECNAGI